MEIKGIDVSKWQGVIDWAKVKANGIQFAIIRATCGTTYLDPQLQVNVKGCEANGIPYGFYHYTYAKTVQEAETEADYFLKVISSFSPSYPVFFDIEDNSLQKLSKGLLTDITIAFCSKLEKAGYFVGVYASKYWFTSLLDYNRVARFDSWLAQYNATATWNGKYSMWQHCCDGKINGIQGDVDLNIAYKDYPAIIRQLGLNKLKDVAPMQPPVPTERYSITFTDISSKDECEALAKQIGDIGYKNHRIEVQK